MVRKLLIGKNFPVLTTKSRFTIAKPLSGKPYKLHQKNFLGNEDVPQYPCSGMPNWV